MNGYFEEINYTNKSKYKSKKSMKIKNYEELFNKIRYLTRSVTKKSDDYNEKIIKIKLNSDDKLPQNKTIEILLW